MANSELDRLGKLKEKRDQLSRRIQKMEASGKKKQRKQDTRRKILIGSYYMDKALANNGWDDLVAVMDKFLTRDSDRVLFDLSKIEKE